MALRVRLTKRVVQSVTIPDRGELWISDTEVPGFGIRLWRTRAGPGGAFAIRVRNLEQRIVRESFQAEASRALRTDGPNQARDWSVQDRLANCLADARLWAKERVAIHRGQITPSQRRRIRLEMASDRMARRTLGDLCEAEIAYLKNSQRRESYVDRLDKLSSNMPDGILSCAVSKIEPKLLANTLTAPILSPTNARTLQSFVGQVFHSAAQVCPMLMAVWHDVQSETLKIWHLRRTSGESANIKISQIEFKELFSRLDAETERWAQALAIKLYFQTGAKLSRVLKARRDQVAAQIWYPYSPSERDYWYLGIEPINANAAATLALATRRMEDEDLVSRYYFPSTTDPSHPISTVSRFWRQMAQDMGWHELSLNHAARAYKPRTTPSYTYMTYAWSAPIYRKLEEQRLVSNGVKFDSEGTIISISSG